MKSGREIEILFEHCAYDQLERPGKGIQRAMKERYGAHHVRSEIEHMRVPGHKTA